MILHPPSLYSTKRQFLTLIWSRSFLFRPTFLRCCVLNAESSGLYYRSRFAFRWSCPNFGGFRSKVFGFTAGGLRYFGFRLGVRKGARRLIEAQQLLVSLLVKLVFSYPSKNPTKPSNLLQQLLLVVRYWVLGLWIWRCFWSCRLNFHILPFYDQVAF